MDMLIIIQLILISKLILITQIIHSVEQKFKDPYQAKKHFGIVITSNKQIKCSCFWGSARARTTPLLS